MTDLSLRVRARKRELEQQQVAERMVRQRADDLRAEIEKLVVDVETHERATILLNSIGEEKQYAAQSAIEALVTRGLQTIFDDSLSFHIRQKVVGKRAEVDFVVRTTLANGSIVETDVMDARGGGLAATVGFLLRLVVMLLRSGNTKDDNVLILDETFAHVSEEYLPALNEFLRKIVDKTGVQIIMVTHQPEFTELADKVYRFSSVDGKTIVKEES